MTVDIMDLVGHRVERYCVAGFHNGGTCRVTVVLDNGVVIEPLDFCYSVSYKTTDEMAQWIHRVGRKVLSASKSPRDSAFTLLFGKGKDGTCFKVRVLPDMIRR